MNDKYYVVTSENGINSERLFHYSTELNITKSFQRRKAAEKYGQNLLKNMTVMRYTLIVELKKFQQKSFRSCVNRKREGRRQKGVFEMVLPYRDK